MSICYLNNYDIAVIANPPGSPLLVHFVVEVWAVVKASGQVVSAGRGQHSAPRLAAAPYFRLVQARGQPGAMGILERIGEIEKEIARTQKNKGEGLAAAARGCQADKCPPPPAPRPAAAGGTRALGVPQGRGSVLVQGFMWRQTRPQCQSCSSPASVVSWSCHLGHILQQFGAYTLV